MDVGTWLIGLGLGQYEAVFRESEIDADVLTELTDQHLKDLGIALGHRLKLLRAIRQLAGEAAIKASEQPKPQDAADRRQLTVMFCDLVDSTALTAQLDPEDVGHLLRAFQRAEAAEVPRFEGAAAKWPGAGASFYFGYPPALEEDPEREARAVPRPLGDVAVEAGYRG